MLELGIVSGVLLIGALIALVPADPLLFLGASGIVLGLVGGLPAAALYHGKLYLALKATGNVPRWWWVSPVKYHDQIDEQAEEGFRWSFRVGAAGFGLIVLGCVMAAAALWKLQIAGEG